MRSSIPDKFELKEGLGTMEALTERYYYVRDDRRRPVITVCLMLDQDGKVAARGMSVCSKSDNPCKKTGRKIAWQRAEFALSQKCFSIFTSTHFITQRACEVLESGIWPDGEELESKIINDPHYVTKHERRIIARTIEDSAEKLKSGPDCVETAQ